MAESPPLISFKRKYFFLFLILLCVEVIIALYISDKFVRPYLGDFLVVVMLYCFLKAFFNIAKNLAAVVVLLFAYFIEFLQYLQITRVMKLHDQKFTTTVLGTQFEWMDMLAYTMGVVFVVLIEWVRRGKISTYSSF